METKYNVIYSARKTLALEITQELTILIRAPLGIRQDEISAFVAGHQAWIAQGLRRMEERKARHPLPSDAEERVLRAAAQAYIPQRVTYYSEQMGLNPTGIRITSAKTRFGSCSGRNRLCFSWYLMAFPAEAIDYVVVHELAHITHKNHSKEFYALIANYLPDWKERRQLLR